MTDIEKIVNQLEFWGDIFGVEVETFEKSIKAGPRRYYFNGAGEIEKIITYHVDGKPTIARGEI